MQSITILGSTGSIGQSTLDIIARHPDRFRVEALTAYQNIAQLFRQCQLFKPSVVAVKDAVLASELQKKLIESRIKTDVLFGVEALSQIAANKNSDTVVAAIVGSVGLLPTLAAIKAGKRVLLANKEALVMGAELFMRAVREHHATLLPIDSEHNAIFQCLPENFLPGKKLQGVDSLILTASGGPFRTIPVSELENATPLQAAAHPNWKMGQKVSIDSATMMNKGLEVIEAFWLFGLPIEKIQVLIHPQSIIHSLVVFSDSSLLAQLGCPDMRIPITHALSYPDRIVSGAKRLDLTEIARLDFEPVSLSRFPCVRLAYQALKAGGAATVILNAANEIAVQAFCRNQIRFTDIAVVVDSVLQKADIMPASSLEAILDADKYARELCHRAVKDVSGVRVGVMQK